MATKKPEKTMEYQRTPLGKGPLLAQVVDRFVGVKYHAGMPDELEQMRTDIKAGRSVRDSAFSKDEADALVMLAHFKNLCLGWLSRNGQKT